jgi:hypothetical protein
MYLDVIYTSEPADMGASKSKVCIYKVRGTVREPVGWGRETNFTWFGTSVQAMEHIFLPRELTVYNS